MAGLLDDIFGESLADPRSQAMAALSGGLLQGNFGAGITGASKAYADAKQGQIADQYKQLQLRQAQAEMEDAERKRQFLAKLPSPQFQAGAGAMANGQGPTLQNAASTPPVDPMMQTMYQGVQAGAVPLGEYLKMMQPKALPVSEVSPEKFTPASLAKFAQTRNYADLVPRDKLEQTEGVIWNPMDPSNAGRALPNPNKPFTLGANGQAMPNQAYQDYELRKANAGAARTNVSVNTEKNLLGGIADGLSKGITDARGGAQAALSTIGTVNRLNDALDSGKVLAGPGTSFRQFGLQIGSTLGVSGKDAQEKLLNTRQAIQSLAQLELDAAQQMKGQGQITEAERSIIRRAASGDIDGMTAPELRLLGGVLDRTARTKIRSYNEQVKPLASNPNAAPLAPFLNVQEPPARGAAGTNLLRFDAQGNLIP